MALSLALDLGTTRIKGAALLEDGTLGRVVSRPAPALRGADPIREGDAAAYRYEAERVLEEAREGFPRDLPIGIASQRSTLVLWDRQSGAAVTPMISWLDRRAAGWCERHAIHEAEVIRTTGLRLSPHYAGPKLAAMIEGDVSLAHELSRGELSFGNLDAWVLRGWAADAPHETDLGMAARTLLVDIANGQWSESMLELFGIPREVLPTIVPTAQRSIRLRSGALVTATAADQGAALLAAVGTDPDAILVNLGTGGFALRLREHAQPAPAGFLLGPVVGGGPSRGLDAIEGTISGVAIAIDRCVPGPTMFPEEDPAPEAFCLPDCAGVGAPHWLPRLAQAFSPSALRLAPADRRRVVLEGILFRVRELVEGMSPDGPPRSIRLTGGLAHEPHLAAAMAACLGRPVDLLEDVEATLLGAAQLAAGRRQDRRVACTSIAPSPPASYLARKFDRFQQWLRAEVLVTSLPPGGHRGSPRCDP